MKNSDYPFTRLLSHAFSLSATNIWRNKILSFATIFVMAIILFIFNIILAVNFTAHSFLDEVNQKVDIVVDLVDEVDITQKNSLIKAIKSQPTVTNVEFTSKEQALKNIAKTHPKTVEFLSRYELQNPLPPSIKITTRSTDSHKQILEFLKQNYPQYLRARSPLIQKEESSIMDSIRKNLTQITTPLNHITFWIILIFIIGGTLVIMNAIQLTIYTRQKEIHIMRLVGATSNFIRLPYILEGMFYSLCAVITSVLVFSVASQQINIPTLSLFRYVDTLPFGNIFLIELVLTMLIGIISSTLAVNRYLTKQLHT